MRIQIDGYNLGLEHGTGVATYGRALSHALSDAGHEVAILYGKRFQDKQIPILNEIYFYNGHSEPPKGIWGSAKRNIGGFIRGMMGHKIFPIERTGSVIPRPHDVPPTGVLVYNCCDLYVAAIQRFRSQGAFTKVPNAGADIAHWTYPLPIMAKDAKNYYTLHDLVPLRLPATTLDHKKKYFSLCTKLAQQSDRIITVSECSRQDIINILGVRPEKVINTYQTVDIPHTAPDQADDMLEKRLSGIYGLHVGGYFMFYGAIEPKKNLPRLLEAYLSVNTSRPLVIVGAPGWDRRTQLKLIDSIKGLANNASQRVILLEYLPRAMLLDLIRGARAVLFPSLYEGFGLPVLESMMLGTPVLTSCTSSLPEVGGDAVHYVDPREVSDIYKGISKLDGDSIYCTELRSRGIVQAQKFSQANYRLRLAEAYT